MRHRWLQGDENGEVTHAFHSGDMNQWRSFAVINIKEKTDIVFFANSKNGLILADQILSSVGNFKYGLNSIFQKFGFARNLEPGWQDKEIKRVFKIIKENEPLV